MPDPREVFEHPGGHWDFLTTSADTDFEGQYFDRKEAGRVGQNGCVSSSTLTGVLEQVTECIWGKGSEDTVGEFVREKSRRFWA